jgi:crossover junction endodeoxyribonuclease RuvC
MGIDPGVSGAIAIYDPEADEMQVWEMPKRTLRSRRYSVDGERLAILMNDITHEVHYVLVESVHSMPQQGVASTFAFGQGFGQLLGVLAGTFTRYALIQPHTWKQRMQVTADKETSIDAIRTRFPQHFHLIKNNRSKERKHGLAEAMLLAVLASQIPRSASAVEDFIY